MSLSTLRVLGAAVFGAVLLSACTQDTATAPTARLDLQAAAATGLVINEVMPNPNAVLDDFGEWFEVYNPGSADVDLKGYTLASANDAAYVIPTSVVVPAGGFVVLARSGDVTKNGGLNATHAYRSTFTLANGTTDWLALRDASGASVDSVAWGTASPPTGASRGVVNAAADNVVMSGANWSTATSTYGLGDKGTPGAVNDGSTTTPPPPPPPSTGTGAIVINEILADPNAVLDADGEWFEVVNRTAAPVSLQGWKIVSRGDAGHTITAAVTVPANGYLVLGRNDNSGTNGGVAVGHVFANVNLGNSSDHLVLKDGAGATADSVDWAVTAPRGASRSVIDAAADNTDAGAGTNWFTSTAFFGAGGDKGTPGAANSSTGGGGQPGVVASISISINTPRSVPAGYTKPAFPTARDAFNTVVSPPPAYTWTTSDASVAVVDSLGYITGVSAGTVTVTATAPNGVSGTAQMTILPGTAPTPAVYRNHVEFGTPAAPGVLLSKPQFAASYSETRGGPNWVSWNINATQFGAAPRCDCFSADQTLPSGTYRVVDFDYRNGGYDRGHMVQSESRTTTDQENASTFLLTNILPQAGENNQGPWSKFENHLNDLARQQGKEIYVVAGGEYSANPATIKGQGRVQIPEWTWKVAVVMDGGEGLNDVRGTGDVQVLAIRMPNDTAAARGMRNNPWEMYAVTVDQIEARTGYDLLDKLPNTIERIVEANDRAPVAATDGPYIGIEGSPVTLDASGSTDPDGDALTYEWSFGDGTNGTGARPVHVYTDNGTYPVSVIVSDEYGAADTATTVVTVMNAAPTVAAFSGAALLRGESYAAAGSFADAGDDTFTAIVDYGDGSGPRALALDGGTFALAHRYTSAGIYTVTVRVTDDDGAEGVRTSTVTVQSPEQGTAALINAVQNAHLQRGEEVSLVAKLRAAQQSLARGNDGTAANQLGAFIHELEAQQRTGRISGDDAARFSAEAQRIIRSIEG